MIRDCRLFSLRTVLVGISMSFATSLCGLDATAQVSRVAATLEGNVRDSSGAPMSGSQVSVRNTFTSQARTVTTDEHGFFRAEQLAVGTYEVRIEQAGFAPYQRTGVVLSLGLTIHLDVVLSLASASERVTVSAQTSTIDTSQTSVVSSVDQERIEELPVRSRDYLDFVLLAPAVSRSPRASAASGSSPLTGSGFTSIPLSPQLSIRSSQPGHSLLWRPGRSPQLSLQQRGPKRKRQPSSTTS
jgi:hypothetical protein